MALPATIIVPQSPVNEFMCGAVACGPPTLNFLNRRGVGATGNLIISSEGEVISYDPASTGVNYHGSIIVKVYDNCGKGSGAFVRPVTGKVKVFKDPKKPVWKDENGFVIVNDRGQPVTVRDENDQIIRGEGFTIGIIDLIVEESGINYLSSPNGDFGGSGRVWAFNNETIIERSNKKIDPPLPGNIVAQLNPGDIITMPPNTEVVTEPDDPSIISETGISGFETIFGGSPHKVKKSGKLTTPSIQYQKTKSPYPISSTGAYPTILCLEDIVVKEGGVAYREGDEVIIRPDNGSKAEPEFYQNGSVKSIKVTSPGEGFQEKPVVYIKSNSGFNSVLIPKLSIKSIGKDQVEDRGEFGSTGGVVQVIDCVGKF